MTVEAVAGAVYHDPGKVVTKQRTEQSVQELNTANINITEIPGNSAKIAGSNQTGKEMGGSQNQNTATEQQIKNAINKVNSKMKTHRTRCEFSYHEETNRVSIKVYDKETEEVIREIPPEEALEMIEKMWELAGLLVDEKR